MNSFLLSLTFLLTTMCSSLLAQDFKSHVSEILKLPKFSYHGSFSEWRNDSSEFFSCTGFVAMEKAKMDTNYGYNIFLEDSDYVRAYLYEKIWVFNKNTKEATVGTFSERNHQLHSNNLAANCLLNFIIYDAFVVNSTNTESKLNNVKSAYYNSPNKGNNKILELKVSNEVLPDEYIVISENKNLGATKRIVLSDKNYDVDIQNLFKNKMPDTSLFKKFVPEKFEIEALDSGFSFSGIKVFDPIKNDSFLLTDRYKGKYLLLDFMFFSCGPCIKSIPELVKANNHYQSKNVSIIALTGNDKADSKKYADFKSTHGINYPVFNIPKELQTSLKKIVAPTYVLLSPEGKVIIDVPMSLTIALAKLDEELNKKK